MVAATEARFGISGQAVATADRRIQHRHPCQHGPGPGAAVHHTGGVIRGQTCASPGKCDAKPCRRGQSDRMNEKTQTENRRRPTAGPTAAHHDHDHDREHEHEQAAGIDLPIFGHVPYKSVGFLAGLGVAGAVGVIEWPVAAAVGIGYTLARR